MGSRCGSCFAPAMVLVTVIASGCDGQRLSSACRVTGVCDPPAPEPVRIDVLLDVSDGSTTTREAVGEILESLLQFSAVRPGSSLHLWELGLDAATTARIGVDVSVDDHARSSPQAPQTGIARFVSANRTLLLDALHPLFSQQPRARSPIAEGLSKISFAATTNHDRLMVVVGDGREYSDLADLECPSSDQEFLENLREHQVLAPGSLSGVFVVFTLFQLVEVPGHRCESTIAGITMVRQLWSEALGTAGASKVWFTSEAVSVGGLEDMFPRESW